MRNRLILLACGGLLASFPVTACDDGGTSGTQGVVPVDGSDTSVAGDTVAADDTGPADAEDVAADTAVPEDTTPAQDVPEPFVGPRAHVFERDPISDEFKTIEVTLNAPTSDDGRLAGEFVDVRNCGLASPFSLCAGGNAAIMGDDGHYTHIVPPPTYNDGSDAFAEVMMYHHVNVMHDYFKDVHGLLELDYPIPALVNLDFGVPNAAYIPAEGLAQFGLPAESGGAIIFFQYQFVDFAYDAAVIYHEYVHAMIGTTRLSGGLVDQWGIDNLPGAMNEGFADYFSASVSGHPLIGNFALESLQQTGQNLRRDLTETRRCPADLTGEVHADGKIIGSAMWAVQQELGKEVADGVILAALQQFSNFTNLEGAGQLVLAEAQKLGVDQGAAVEAILIDHGIIGCERAREWTAFNALASPEGLPYFVAGRNAVGGANFPDGVPGYFQFYVDVAPGTAGVTLSIAAQSAGGFGGGGGPNNLGVALRKNEPVVFGVLTGGSVFSDFKLTPASTGTQQVVTFGGDCLPAGGGRIYLMLLNSQNGDAQIAAMGATHRDTLDGAPSVVTCQ